MFILYDRRQERYLTAVIRSGSGAQIAYYCPAKRPDGLSRSDEAKVYKTRRGAEAMAERYGLEVIEIEDRGEA